MRKKILMCILLMPILLTGCNSKKEDDLIPKDGIITGVSSIIEYNVYEEDAKNTKVRLTITNNSKDDLEINNITFKVELNSDEVKKVEKEIKHTIKAGEEYQIESEADVLPSNVKSIEYVSD